MQAPRRYTRAGRSSSRLSLESRHSWDCRRCSRMCFGLLTGMELLMGRACYECGEEEGSKSEGVGISLCYGIRTADSTASIVA